MANPYHDPQTGQFTDGPSGGGMSHVNGHLTGDGASDHAIKASLDRVVKTATSIQRLGAAALGAAALAATLHLIG